MKVIDEIVGHAKMLAAGEHETVWPGQEQAFTTASSVGDYIRQGDLYLIVVDKVPCDYVEIDRPNARDKQLVPGNTEGAKHCLDSLGGVKLFRPREWNEETLKGPAFVLSKDRTVLHPTHGNIIIPAGTTVVCRYQREWDREQAAERRARD
jgi:hypothetical protein